MGYDDDGLTAILE